MVAKPYLPKCLAIFVAVLRNFVPVALDIVLRNTKIQDPSRFELLLTGQIGPPPRGWWPGIAKERSPDMPTVRLFLSAVPKRCACFGFALVGVLIRSFVFFPLSSIVYICLDLPPHSLPLLLSQVLPWDEAVAISLSLILSVTILSHLTYISIMLYLEYEYCVRRLEAFTALSHPRRALASGVPFLNLQIWENVVSWLNIRTYLGNVYHQDSRHIFELTVSFISAIDILLIIFLAISLVQRAGNFAFLTPVNFQIALDIVILTSGGVLFMMNGVRVRFSGGVCLCSLLACCRYYKLRS